MPPMMFANIVGQASFHTAGRRGPSMIDRSYRRATGAGGGGGIVGAETRSAVVITSVIERGCASRQVNGWQWVWRPGAAGIICDT